MTSDRSVLPNIVYFVCHDLGRHLGCYRLPFSTPHLDRFAGEARRFTQAFCASPACSPSRACAMTGRYAHCTGAIGLSHMGWPLDLGHRTIIDDLNTAGYATIHSGINHERHPRTDRYAVDLPETWDDFSAASAVSKAIAHLARRESNRPFYLNVSTSEPHPSTWKEVGDRIPGPVPPDEVVVPLNFPDSPLVRETVGAFQSSIIEMDRRFGELMEALDRFGLRETAWVIFTTDHGINGLGGKGTLYDLGTQTALMVRAPDGSGAGTVCDALVSNIDLRPTLCELAGVPAPDVVDGKSFAPLLRGEIHREHEAIFTERNFHGEYRQRPQSKDDTGFIDLFDPIRSIRTSQYHYIRWWHPDGNPHYGPIPPCFPPGYEPDGETFWNAWPPPDFPRRAEALFDVTRDALEWVDLAGRPEYQEVKRSLNSQLEEWMTATDDFLLTGKRPVRPMEPGWGPNWPLQQ